MVTSSAESVLVIAPHPDDASIGCGGTVAKHADAGRSVTIVNVTDGEMGGVDYDADRLAERRRREARDAAEALGADRVKFHGQPDGGVTYDRVKLQYYIELIREESPAFIYYPSTADADHDHTVVADLIRSALRKAYSKTFPEAGIPPQEDPPVAYEYEVWTPIAEPTTFEPIDDVRDRKERAIQSHESQLSTIDYDAATFGLNRYRGAMSQAGQYAEAFKISQFAGLSKHAEANND